MVGRALAHYRIEEKLGAGGMGVVYRARDTQLERLVALKVLNEQGAADDNARTRLLREARTASALNHPNICIIYESGVADGQTYIAMELVEGRPLSAMIGSEGLPVEMVIRYGVQIADALAHAHERGVVHRDLKSANVIITPQGRPKVLDFGLAKRVLEPDEVTRSEDLTKTGVVAGTLPYMAPEVLQGEPADMRSDLWALGVTLYQAVTGTLPFRGTTTFQISSAIVREAVPPLPAHVPPGLCTIIQRLLEKQPGERYQRAGEVRAALEATQPHMTAARVISPRVMSRRRGLWAVASLPVAAAMTWLGLRHLNKPAASPLGPRLSDGSKPSTNRAANEYYERGLQFSGSGPRIDLVQWRRMLERALELDPKFAAARGQYAFTTMIPVAFGALVDPSSFYKAEEDARQALRDDPACTAAHSALAGVYLNLGRKELVPGEVEKALQVNSQDPAIHLCLPMYHLANGDYQRAIQQIKQIVTRWPLFWPARVRYSQALREQGDTSGAISELERVLEQVHISGVFWWLAWVYMDTGDLRSARQALEGLDDGQRQIQQARLVWALLLALEGKKKEALREMDERTLAYAGASYLGPLQPAEVYAVVGDTAKALDWLDRAVRWGDEREDWFRRDPYLASLRNHPRFQQIVEAVAYRRKQRASEESKR